MRSYTLPPDFDEWLAEAKRRVDAIDAEHARDYGLTDDTPVRWCRDRGLVILCSPRLQLSPQQAALLKAIPRGEDTKLPRRSTASAHASRSRAVRRLREQGLVSHSHRLRLTPEGERLAAILCERREGSPVNDLTACYNLNRVQESATPLTNGKDLPDLNRAITDCTPLTLSNSLEPDGEVLAQ